MATAVAKLPVEPTQQTDFADDRGLSLWAKPFVNTTAANGLVSGYQTAGGWPRYGTEPHHIGGSKRCDSKSSGRRSTARNMYRPRAYRRNGLGAKRGQQHVSVGRALPSCFDAGQRRTDYQQVACEMLYRAMLLMEKLREGALYAPPFR